MLPAGVLSLLALCLSFDVVVGIAVGGYDGAALVTYHKGRFHIINGLSHSVPLDLFPSSCSPKITSSYCTHESTVDP